MLDPYPLPRFCFYPGGAGVRVTSTDELAALPPGWSSVPDGPFTEGVTSAVGALAPGVTRRRLKDLLPEVLRLRSEGLTMAAVGVHLGITTRQVGHLLCEMRRKRTRSRQKEKAR